MKMTKKPIAVLLIVFSTAFSTMGSVTVDGDTGTNVLVSGKKGTAVYNLTYMDDTAGNLKVTIMDEAGYVVYTEYIKYQKSFVKPFNLRNLPAGNYKFVIKNGEDVYEELIAHQLTIPEFDISAERLADAGKIKLTVKGQEMLPLTVRIFDADQELVYSKSVKSEKSFFQIYDISKVKAEQAVTIEIFHDTKMLEKITL